MNNKVLRAMYGPSIFEVVLGALLSLSLGVVLAGLYLVFKPVSVVNQLPTADKREEGMVYYVQGEKGAGRGGQLLRKQQLSSKAARSSSPRTSLIPGWPRATARRKNRLIQGPGCGRE